MGVALMLSLLGPLDEEGQALKRKEVKAKYFGACAAEASLVEAPASEERIG